MPTWLVVPLLSTAGLDGSGFNERGVTYRCEASPPPIASATWRDSVVRVPAGTPLPGP